MQLWTQAYSFDSETGYYTGGVRAWEDPMAAGSYLLPANSTFLAPPSYRDGFVRVWDGSGWIYSEAAPAPEPDGVPTPEEHAEQIRGERNQALTECDWTQLPDVPISVTARTAFIHYRQALRDIPSQP